jgi:intracellular sulfur oxidation DsrE/DsrF family protein
MKNLIIVFLFMIPLAGISQTKPVKIVFDVTSKDTLTHQAVLRHVKGMSETYPDALLEVVVYGGAWPMLVKGKTPSGTTVEKLAQEKNISFKLCGITMERYKVAKADLLNGVEVVPDAIIEIVTRQGEGWGYIKEAHN